LVFRVAHDNDCRPQQLLIAFARDRKLYEYGLRRADVILAQSLRQQEDLRTYYGMDSMMAAMFVESPSRVLPFAERDIDILWVNNLAEFKRPDLVVDLARRLPDRRIVMIGGTQAGAEHLYRMVSDAAAECANLEFLGPVPYHEVNDYYARARLFVNTSDSEGFPNSYLQSWVRGTPLVAFFDPDGVVARERLGVVPADLAGMAEAVERLLGDETEWRTIGHRAMDFMKRDFSEDMVLPPYLEACGLDAAAGRHGRGSA
jgi:glycosyltransferase involved in cell wall biosynthesis